MNKTNIEWCDYTWNPVTGCKRGCKYCYAKRIHDRFNSIPFSIITYHSNRIAEPSKLKKPATIFVGSMSDIEYWNKDFTLMILAECQKNKRHTFMFLSKNPKSYAGFCWPSNTMQGLTLTSSHDIGAYYALTQMCSFPRPYLSIEPLLGPVLYHSALEAMEKIIVGAMTGPHAIAPLKEHIDNLKQHIPSNNLFLKTNIKRYWGN